MESSKTSRYERASKAVGGSIMKLGGSFKKRSHAKKPTLKSSASVFSLAGPGVPSSCAAQEQKEPSFGKRKTFALTTLQASVGDFAGSPLKRARTWTSKQITIQGGVAQPQRVIGYHRTQTALDVAFRVSGSIIEAHSNVIAAVCNLQLPHLKQSDPVDLPPPCHPEAMQGE